MRVENLLGMCHPCIWYAAWCHGNILLHFALPKFQCQYSFYEKVLLASFHQTITEPLFQDAFTTSLQVAKKRKMLDSERKQ